MKERKMFMHIIERKTLEISIYNSMENLPIAYRTAITSQLEDDIARCNVYLRIFANDFSQIDLDMNILAPRENMIPVELHEHYLNSLEQKDLEEESALLFCYSLGLGLYFDLNDAMKLIAENNTMSELITYSEFLSIQKVRQLLEKSKERCELLLDETDLPYEDAYQYIDCMLEECSILTMIHLSKEIGLDELFMHLEYHDKVSSENYNKLFLPDIEPERRIEMLNFQKCERRNSILILAQILIDYELGIC